MKKLAAAILLFSIMVMTWSAPNDNRNTEPEINKYLKGIPYMETLKISNFELYDKFYKQLNRKINQGASKNEIYKLLKEQGTEAMLLYLPKCSDQALLGYYKSTVEVMEYLRDYDPEFGCKYLFSQYYGHPDYSELEKSEISVLLYEISTQFTNDIITTGVNNENNRVNYDKEKAAYNLNAYYMELYTGGEININFLQNQKGAVSIEEKTELINTMVLFYKGFIDNYPPEVSAGMLRYMLELAGG